MVMPYTAIQFAVLHKLKTVASGSSKSVSYAFSPATFPEKVIGVFNLFTTVMASCNCGIPSSLHLSISRQLEDNGRNEWLSEEDDEPEDDHSEDLLNDQEP
ncbi:hypothetical protein GIB67_006889 [Kingdonia uniflora]|uniref:Uncharacterized protein n=1 Tax=Kingdonia uniflora TaxID=39325 RepID=A0A7J7L077_9MAGN|nr:hypothetical protein GIB67_006889 [Kingdonia uniflora]